MSDRRGADFLTFPIVFGAFDRLTCGSWPQ